MSKKNRNQFLNLFFKNIQDKGILKIKKKMVSNHQKTPPNRLIVFKISKIYVFHNNNLKKSPFSFWEISLGTGQHEQRHVKTQKKIVVNYNITPPIVRHDKDIITLIVNSD